MRTETHTIQPGDRVTVAGHISNGRNQIGLEVPVAEADGVVRLIDEEYDVALIEIHRPGAPDYVFVGIGYLRPVDKEA